MKPSEPTWMFEELTLLPIWMNDLQVCLQSYIDKYIAWLWLCTYNKEHPCNNFTIYTSWLWPDYGYGWTLWFARLSESNHHHLSKWGKRMLELLKNEKKKKKIIVVAVYVVLLSKEIQCGSPPHSSNTTNRFPLGFSHERGTWYLRVTSSLSLFKIDK